MLKGHAEDEGRNSRESRVKRFKRLRSQVNPKAPLRHLWSGPHTGSSTSPVPRALGLRVRYDLLSNTWHDT